MRSRSIAVRLWLVCAGVLLTASAQAALFGIVDGGLSPTPTPPPPVPYVPVAGDVADTRFLRQVKGFAYNETAPGVFAQVSVDLYINNVRVATTLANQPRQDVRTNRGVNIDTGFTFNVPAPALGAMSFTVDVKFNGTNTSLTGPLDPAYTTPQGAIPFRYYAPRPMPFTVTLEGLTGRYYDVQVGNTPLPQVIDQSSLRAVQVDPNLSFTFNNFITNVNPNDKPHIYINPENYAITWTGDYVPTASGNLQIGSENDDNVLIFLNGTLMLDRACCAVPALQFSGTEPVVAGRRYELIVHFSEGVGGSNIRLYHQGIVPQAIIPNANLFANRVPKVNKAQLVPGTLNLSYTLNEDTAVNFGVAVSDADGDAFSTTILTLPANGVLSGTFPNLTYTPNPNWNGTDSFTFRMYDGLENSDTYTVLFNVTAVNDVLTAAADTFSVLEDVATPLSVLANDNAVDTPITVVIITPPTKGTVQVNADGTITYTSNLNYSGPDSFVYRATDTMGGETGTATVTLNVLPVNDPPVPGTDSIITGENAVLSLTTALLVANDSDPVEGQSVSIVAVSATSAAGGTVTFAGSTIIYTPPLDFFGSDSFTYTLADSGGATATGTVQLTVVEGPTFSSPPVITPNPTVVGQQVFFSASATYVAGPGPFRWEFGDGTTAVGASVTHTYTTAGFYTVRVFAIDANGAQTLATQELLVSFNLEGQTGSGAINPPGEGILIGGAGAGVKTGSGKIQIDYQNRERTLFTAKLNRITFPPTVSQEALEGQIGLLTLGTGALAEAFVFTLNDKGRGVTTKLRKIEINIAKRSIQFQAGGVPELTDLAESLGAAYQFTRKPLPRTIKMPARITFADVPGFALALTFQMTVKQSRSVAKGATK